MILSRSLENYSINNGPKTLLIIRKNLQYSFDIVVELFTGLCEFDFFSAGKIMCNLV